MVAGTLRARVEITPTETVFNDDSADLDFRVESNGNANMLFVDGGNNVVCFDTTDVNPAENNVAGVGILTGGKISASADGNFGLQVNRKSSFGGVIHLRKDGAGRGFLAIFEDSSSGRLLLGNDNTCLLFNDSTKQIIPFQSTGSKQDDVISLGNASGRFDQVFCANSNLNTSDRNEKQDIEELSDAEKRVAVRCKGLIRKYRWKKRVAEKGDNARIHVGLIAQDLQDAFTAEGLDATKYSMFCSDTYWDNDEVYVDDDGVSHNIVKSYYTEEEAPDGATKKTRLGVRYDEIFAFIISAI
jgi:prepilin-type processing-associated H-X9-DG protein